jgi:hypothetical protein
MKAPGWPPLWARAVTAEKAIKNPIAGTKRIIRFILALIAMGAKALQRMLFIVSAA